MIELIRYRELSRLHLSGGGGGGCRDYYYYYCYFAYCYHYFYWIFMANHEVWVRVAIVGVSISGKRVGGAGTVKRQQADVRFR